MRNIKAMEIFTSGICNMDCKYCYIPKSQVMRDIHNNILNHLISFNLSDIRELASNIEYLGLWGAEPTMSLNYISEQIDNIKRILPRLKEISFSTNGMNLDVIKDMIDKCNCAGINLEVQFSFDGPEYINGMNRMPNTLEKVIGNFKSLIIWLNQKDLKIRIKLRGKATLTIENVKYLLKHNLVSDYVNFFEKISRELATLSRSSNVILILPLTFNMEVPGTYTSEDGRYFARFMRKIHELGFDSVFTSRLERVINLRNSLSTKPSMFSCSGGDSNIGYDFRKIHICHRSFMLDNEAYLKDILEHKPNNWDVQNLARGTASQVMKYYIVSPKNLNRFVYLLRAYHDFWRLRLTHTIVEIKELALSGQISPYYKSNDDLALLFALFLNTANACPMENVLVTGSLFFVPPSIIRLWGNGAFYELIKRTVRR